MKLRTRRIIMISFIAAFFILAPILIFYSSGYRYDFKRGKVLKTGTLMLEAKNIRNADLYINDKLQEEPFNGKVFIYNLLPDEYRVRLEKADYYPWQKKITIHSSITTFAKDIILFKKNVPLQIIDGEIINFSLSPDLQKIVYLKETDSFLELHFFNPETKKKNLLYRTSLTEKATNLAWAASSKKILAKINENYLIFNTQSPEEIIAVKDFVDFKPINVKWDIQSDNLIYILKENSIYKIDLLAQNSELIFKTEQDKEINSEFFIESNDLFYIQRQENRDILYKYNFNFQTNKKVIELNRSTNYQFLKSTNNFIGLIDLDQQKVFLIKKIITDLEINIKSKEPIKEFSAKKAVWDKDEKQLLIYDDFEIIIYNTKTNEKTFINRYGQEIKKALWYPDLLKTVIQFGDNIKIIDIFQENGTRNITEIVNFEQLGTFYLDKKGETMYFNGQIGKQQGIYQLKLR